ncbi:cell division initiation protein [Streptomyces agglomeratus]|uniref:Cell division initiation protein n=1 Tax=Streptomyces agglomeratus TaxID=285458 RepID=A0A1E5P5I1_9ACTN|nr:ATP synthase F0 subunit B [Streptomyces agglomeratus]OEJ24828.1 cell division initiation protein [Streptomyces agglomeratus]OEJ41163.1 cell division initiation protein [Streptomyces agglomeratus]OEJ44459.1 cell division initiation protein [Streptomyces agglomeratus]OEJ53704.1 cell division initiation protein [Streptomyces agglomeratus]OEJ61022.1 cell division initiation protein [Streptomyces agglomeratus]
MDVQKKLDEIVEAVGSARSMPMSASCVVNRADLLSMLEEVRQALPGSLAQAQELIGGHEQMTEQARQEAERIIESAHAERASLISDTEVARRSQEEADRILGEARRDAEEIRAEADEYVDSKLANFEVVLTKTLGSVDRGREKLLGRGPGLDDQGYADEEAPERSHDPETLRQRADEYVDTKLGAFEAVLSKTLEAVGRGRQKLHGRVASDELGAHMVAQDEAGAQHSSDADFLADLAEPQSLVPAGGHQQAPQIPAQQPYDPYAYQQQPQQQDPYAYQQPQDPYAAQQPDPYGYQQDPYAYQQQGYDQGQGQGQDYGHQQQGHVPQQQGALDETSLFDTSMIDLDQLREYEQGR